MLYQETCFNCAMTMLIVTMIKSIQFVNGGSVAVFGGRGSKHKESCTDCLDRPHEETVHYLNLLKIS